MARVKHGQDDWLSYHITTRTHGRAFYLARPDDKRVITDALDFYRRLGRFKVFAFVVMANHVHLIIQPAPGVSLGDIVRNFKAWTSRHNSSKPPGEPLWERRYDDNRIKTAEELRAVIEYVHHNPVRAGIARSPREYAWSSVHNYSDQAGRIVEIDSDWWQY